jgi:hypothetical protein
VAYARLAASNLPPLAFSDFRRAVSAQHSPAGTPSTAIRNCRSGCQLKGDRPNPRRLRYEDPAFVVIANGRLFGPGIDRVPSAPIGLLFFLGDKVETRCDFYRASEGLAEQAITTLSLFPVTEQPTLLAARSVVDGYNRP